MAIEQKLTLTQLESEQNDRYRVRMLWTSTQTPPHWNNVSHYGYLYYAINNGTETTVSVRYKLPAETEQTILDTVIEIPVTGTEPVTVSARTWMDTYLSSVGVVELAESLDLKPLACTVTATDALIGEASAITIRRSGAEHLCSIRYVFGEQSGYLTEDGSITAEETLLAAESISFLLPDSFYAEIPNDTQGTCYLYCTTYSEGIQVGEVQEASFTALTNEERCKPLVTGTVVDVNEITTALTGDDQVLIRYHSDALCTIIPEAQHYAAIQELRINGEVIDGSSLEILNVEQTQVQFAAKDSRGYETVTEEPITLIPYTHLTSTPQVERDDPTSGNATLRYTGLCFSGSFGAAENDLTFEYKIDSGEFLPAEIEYSVEDGRYTAEVKLSGLDYRKVFSIIARVSDRLETVEKKLTLKKGIPVFDWGEEDFVFHVPVMIEGDLHVTGSLTVNGEEIFEPGTDNNPDDPTVETETADPEFEFVVEKNIQDRNSVCVIEETGANVYSADNSAYFNKEYIVVQNDTYKVDKDTMLSLQNKKLVGNGSVAWKDWDSISQNWKDTFDASMLSGKLKVRYADDPVYLSMKLPSEANFETDYITRPGMRASDHAAANLVTVDNIGAIMPIDYTQLPDEIVICVGNLSLYTLSKTPNARWKMHDKCAVPAGYAMYSLPWSTSHDANVSIDDSKVSACDGYMRFTLTKDDFGPLNSLEDSLAKTLHFWGNHKDLNLANNAAVITFFEVWTETPDAVGKLYTASGCDRKSSDNTVISQNFWGRNVLLSKEKTIITGHNISDAVYDALRDTPNDPRLVYADYASVHGSEYDFALLKSQVEKDLADKAVKMDACFSTLEIAEVTKTGVNINPGVYETGYIASGGTDYDGYHDMAFRTKGYIKVESGRNIALYYDKAEWNRNDNGKAFEIVEYDINKTQISERQYFKAYSNNSSPFTLSADTVYIRITYNNWSAYTTPVSDIKAAIYYLEDARLEFVEYYADIEAVYGVKGDSIILTAPNGSKFSLSVANDGTLKTTMIT